MKTAAFVIPPQSLIHLFWSCDKTSYFWNEVTGWLQNLHLLPKEYTLTNVTALGLRPDVSQFALLTISHMAC